MSPSPRFGFTFLPEGAMAETVATYRLGEELGYDCAWVMDQAFHRDPFVLLTLCAQATTKIALGLGITNPYTRHPAQIARAIASVDEASGGRIALGLGAGNPVLSLAPLGITADRRAHRLREALLIMRRLLAGEKVSYESPTLTLKDVQLSFPPQRGVPIYLASRGRLSLRNAGELADGVILQSMPSPQGLAYGIGLVREGAQRAGRSLQELDRLCWQVVRLTEDRAAALAEVGAWSSRPFIQGPQEYLEGLGFSPERIAEVSTVYRAQGPQAAARLLTQEEFDRFIIVGDAKHCARVVQTMAEHGMTTFVLLLLGSLGQVRNTLERFAREVMPRLR